MTDKEQAELARLKERLAEDKANGSSRDCHSSYGHLSYLFHCRNADRHDELVRKKSKGAEAVGQMRRKEGPV